MTCAIRSLGLEIRSHGSVIRSLDLHGMQFVPSIYTMQPEETSCVHWGNELQSERTSFVNRGNESLIRGNQRIAQFVLTIYIEAIVLWKRKLFFIRHGTNINLIRTSKMGVFLVTWYIRLFILYWYIYK